MLLDTNILIWLFIEPERVGPRAIRAVQAAEQRYVSVATQFEVAVKQRLGRFDLLDLLEAEMARQSIQQIPLSIAQFRQLASQKGVSHRDPFDLLIVAVAIEQKLPLLTSDKAILALQLPGLQTLDANK